MQRASIDHSYWAHPKTIKLESILGDMASVLPIRLWTWASLYARNGDLYDQDDDGIERLVGWRGEKGAAVAALRECGFLDGMSVHDWMDWTGKGVVAYDRKLAKQREAYNGSDGRK